MKGEQEIPEAHEQFKLYKDQVSGKTPKFTDETGHYIFKKVSKKQLDFFQYMETLGNYSPNYSLKKHIPEYKGTYHINHQQIQNKQTITEEHCKKDQWINHIASRMESDRAKAKKQFDDPIYIKMVNITENYKYPCIMDIKLGRKICKHSNTAKYKQSTTDSHHFRINGMSKLTNYNEQGNPEEKEYFVSKYYFQKVSEQDIEKHLAFFFCDGKNIDLGLLTRAIEQVKDIIQALMKFSGGKFNSSSLLICYDAKEHQHFAVKFIDFDQYTNSGTLSQDNNILQGLKNTLQYLTSIIHHKKAHQKSFQNKELDIYHHQQVIPDRIMKKYEKTEKPEKEVQEEPQQIQ